MPLAAVAWEERTSTYKICWHICSLKPWASDIGLVAVVAHFAGGKHLAMFFAGLLVAVLCCVRSHGRPRTRPPRAYPTRRPFFAAALRSHHPGGGSGFLLIIVVFYVLLVSNTPGRFFFSRKRRGRLPRLVGLSHIPSGGFFF